MKQSALFLVLLFLSGCTLAKVDLTISPEAATLPLGATATVTTTASASGTYSWAFESVPAGSAKQVGSAPSGYYTVTWVPDVVGVYVLGLTFSGTETLKRSSTITVVANSYLGSWTNSGATFTDFAFGFGNVFTAKRAGIPYSGTWSMRGTTMTAAAGGTDFAFTYSGGLVYSGVTYTAVP